MKYIRSCPTCNTELRFPLDMGTLIITCPNCSHSFKMDPDDPRTYQSGKFDLTPTNKKTSYPILFSNWLSSLRDAKKDIRFIIPIALVLLLILHILKIYNTPVTVEEPGADKPQYFEEPEEPTKPESPNAEPSKDAGPTIEI